MARKKVPTRPTEKLFPDEQRDLFEKSYEEKLQAEKNKAVECQDVLVRADGESLDLAELRVFQLLAQLLQEVFPALFIVFKCHAETLGEGEPAVAMLSSVLRGKRAIQLNIEVMRAFVRLRRLLASHADLARKVDTLERKCDAEFKVVVPPPPLSYRSGSQHCRP